MIKVLRMRDKAHALVLLSVMALAWAAPRAASAGPWVKAPGEVYAKVSGGAFRSDAVFDVNGQEVDAPFVYSNNAVYTYAEVGLIPRAALAISLPFLMSTNTVQERTRYNRSGFGDLDLQLQGQLYKGACAVSGDMGLRLPLYDGIVAADGASPGVDSSNTAARFLPLLGDGSVDLNPGVSVGCSLHPVPAWLTLETALNVRTKGFGHGARVALGAGYFVWPERVALMARAELLKRFSADNERPTKEYLNVGGGALIRIVDGLALEATVSALPWGAFLARGWSANVGISYSGQLFPDPFKD